MFSKASKPAQSTSGSSDTRSTLKSSVPSIISADLRINGDLVCSGDVQVDGWVEGDIQSRNIVIGEGATVHGALQAETVRICGTVKGQVKADSVVLEKTAKVTGDVLHKTLAIEQGASLEGMCKRLEAAAALATPTPANETKPQTALTSSLTTSGQPQSSSAGSDSKPLDRLTAIR